VTRKESLYRVTSKLPAALAAITLMLGVLAGGGTAAWAQTDEEVALSLASLLRASRAVISKNQQHINNPCIGDKGLSAGAVVAKAKENYKKAAGGDLDAIDPASPHGKLIKAELQAITDVMNEAQGLINEKGKGLKGFLPAVYARQVTQKFNPAAAALKLTAPKNYIRNQANSPDKWEDNVIESKFKAAGHPKGQHVSETTTFKGKQAFRLILPEYYKESCLACHGEPKGEKDITGGTKEGAKLGELGGAISVVLFK
jgi:hypothetical protein